MAGKREVKPLPPIHAELRAIGGVREQKAGGDMYRWQLPTRVSSRKLSLQVLLTRENDDIAEAALAEYRGMTTVTEFIALPVGDLSQVKGLLQILALPEDLKPK